MILAIYNDQILITFGETMQQVIDNLIDMGDDYNNPEYINRYVTFFDAKQLNTKAVITVNIKD